MTTADSSAAHPPELAQLVRDAAADITRIRTGPPVLVQLAHAFNGFFVARAVSAMLDAESTPGRDAYPLTVDWCTEALETIYDIVGTALIRRHCSLHKGGKKAVEELTVAAQFELAASTDSDIARIANEMISLAAGLEHLLTSIAQDESALPEPRAAARATAWTAHNIWSHYGGDGGGW